MPINKTVTPEARLSFPHLFEPNSFRDSDPKYSATLLFPKGTDLKPLKKLAAAAVKEKWGDNPPKNLRNPFRDGSEKELEGYEGVTFITASSKKRPGVVDQQVQPILDADEIYAGCYVRASVTAFCYGGKGTAITPGVSFGLQNVQKIRDGEPFSGRSKPEDDFDTVEVEETKTEEDAEELPF